MSKAGKKGGKEKPAELAAQPVANGETEEIKRLYQEKRTQERLDLLEKENATLQKGKKELEERLETHAKKQRDIIWYLHRDIKEKDSEIESLKEKVTRLTKEKEDQAKSTAAEKDALIAETDKQRRDSEAKYAELQSKYQELEHFTQQKTSLENVLTSLQADLEKEKREHALHVNELERRNVAEKNRLKKEMLKKVKETKLSLLAMTEDQLHTTTKRTIMENEQMTTELHYQSKITERLVKQNDELIEQTKVMKRQLELHEEAERMFATRTQYFQKLIAKLNEKLRNAEAQQRKVVSRIGHREKEVSQEISLQERTISTMDTRILELENTLQSVQQENQVLRSRIDRTKRANDHLLLLQDEAATFVLTCLEDVKRQMFMAREREGKQQASSPTGADARRTMGLESSVGGGRKQSKSIRVPPSLSSASPEEREAVLQVLFQRLHNFQNINKNILSPVDDEDAEAQGRKSAKDVDEEDVASENGGEKMGERPVSAEADLVNAAN